MKRKRSVPTKRQMEIYDYIVGYIIENQYSPTVREICEGVGLSSTSSVYSHMETLKELGMIEYKSTQPRTIQVHGYRFVKIENGIYNVVEEVNAIVEKAED